MANLTVVNSVILLSVDGLFPVAQQLQQFSAENIFETEEIEVAETSMGVDGTLSAGLVYVPISQSYNLQANSPSIATFDKIYQSQIAQKDVYKIQMSITIPALGTKYTMTNGFLKKYPPTANAHKIAQPRKFTIEWERISGAAV